MAEKVVAHKPNEEIKLLYVGGNPCPAKGTSPAELLLKGFPASPHITLSHGVKQDENAPSSSDGNQRPM